MLTQLWEVLLQIESQRIVRIFINHFNEMKLGSKAFPSIFRVPNEFDTQLLAARQDLV